MIVEQENILFEKWARTRIAFSRDGIINEIDYLKSDIKVLLILKEVNSKSGEPVDLKEFLQHGAYNRRATWDNVTRWMYGIKNIDKSIHWKEINKKFLTQEKRKQILSSIIIMNLKKSPGKHTTINEELKNVAEQDKSFLNQQFQIYFKEKKVRPDIIICGGTSTSNTFNSLIEIPNKKDWEMTTKGVHYYEFDNGRFFIEFAHPEARVSDNLIYYGLIDAVKEIRNKSN